MGNAIVQATEIQLRDDYGTDADIGLYAGNKVLSDPSFVESYLFVDFDLTSPGGDGSIDSPFGWDEWLSFVASMPNPQYFYAKGSHAFDANIDEHTLEDSGIAAWDPYNPWRIKMNSSYTLTLKYWKLSGGIIQAGEATDGSGVNDVVVGALVNMYVTASTIAFWSVEGIQNSTVVVAGYVVTNYAGAGTTGIDHGTVIGSTNSRPILYSNTAAAVISGSVTNVINFSTLARAGDWTEDAEHANTYNLTTPTRYPNWQDTALPAYRLGAVEAAAPNWAADGNSVLRWSEADVPGFQFASNVLCKDGISDLKESADYRAGGTFVKLNSFTISFDNTGRLVQALQAMGVSLNGCVARLYEFTIDENDGVTGETIRYGEVAVEGWGIESCTIPVNSTQYKRNAQLGTVVDSVSYPNASASILGKIIPPCFGEFTGGHHAELQRTANKETVGFYTPKISGEFYFKVDDDYTYGIVSSFWQDVSIYPVVGNDGDTPPLQYKVKIGLLSAENGSIHWRDINGETVTTGTLDLTGYFNQMYLYVTEGKGSGACRKIASASVNIDVDKSVLLITVQDYFEDSLVGDGSLDVTDQSWVEFRFYTREYTIDTWPCKGFLDSSGNVINSGLELYAYIGEKKVSVSGDKETVIVAEKPIQFVRLPQYAYAEKAGVSGHNLLSIDVKLFNTTPDQMDAFLILPVRDIKLNDESSLHNWFSDVLLRITDGLFTSDGSTGYSLGVHPDHNDINNLIDKDRTSGYWPQVTAPDYRYKKCTVSLKFRFPAISDSITFDSAYLLVNTAPNGIWQTIITYRKWFGNFVTLLQCPEEAGQPNGFLIDAFPDFYYEQNTYDFHNRFFYYNSNGGAFADRYLVSGYSNFLLAGVTDANSYRAIDGASLMFQLVTNGALDAVSIPIHKIAVAFKKSVSISTALYTPFAGRVYNSTWDGRRSISNCVNNLLDVYEFACRAQNWGEVGATEAPGKAYGSGALINTASFDSSELTYAREHRVALQLPDSLCMTEALKRKLCQVGFMGGYIDGNGKECVSTLFPQTFDVNDLVTFADIPDDLQPGEIIEPDASNVYCEPFVRYAYDKASETYTKLAQITNIHEDAWQASFTPGLSAAIGKRIWNKCKANYTAFQHIEEPPTDWTDQPLIIDSDDAEDFLERWVDLMTKKRIPVPVRYSKAKRWHVTRPVYLNLPHQTSGETYECIIEEITKKKNKGYCEIKFILLEKQVVVGANIQDVMYAKIQGADADWQDTMTEYGDDNDKADQMEVV